MNKKRARKYNMRGLFFNSEQPHCEVCGSQYVQVGTLDGTVVAPHVCPIQFAH